MPTCLLALLRHRWGIHHLVVVSRRRQVVPARFEIRILDDRETTLDPRHAARSGFTLIELLVVIAIIAVLAAILLPSLRRAREAGISSVCKSAEHQFGVAMAMYGTDHDNRLVPASLGSDRAFDVLLDPYLNTLPPAGNTEAKTGGLWTCPADYLKPNRSYVQHQRRSYGMNWYLTDVWYWWNHEATAQFDELPHRVVVLGESWEAVIGTRSELGAAQTWYFPSANAVFRHAGNLFGLYHFLEGGNYLFSDGSVEYYLPEDIQFRKDLTAPTRENGWLYRYPY